MKMFIEKNKFKKSVTVLSFVIIFLNNYSFSQASDKKKITINKECSFDNQNRRIVDTLKNKVATVVKKGNLILLQINKSRYIACNLPPLTKHKKILITGYVLQILPTERLIGTPIKIISASSL